MAKTQKIDTKNLLIPFIVALVVSAGVSVTDKTLFDVKDELDGYYGCVSTGDVGQFVRLSSTQVTAYPYKDSNTGYVRCAEKWLPLVEYAQKLGVDPYSLLVPKQQEQQLIQDYSTSPEGKRWLCDQVGCKLLT